MINSLQFRKEENRFLTFEKSLIWFLDAAKLSWLLNIFLLLTAWKEQIDVEIEIETYFMSKKFRNQLNDRIFLNRSNGFWPDFTCRWSSKRISNLILPVPLFRIVRSPGWTPWCLTTRISWRPGSSCCPLGHLFLVLSALPSLASPPLQKHLTH